MSGTHESAADPTAARLRQLIVEIATEQGVSEMRAAVMLGEQLALVEHEIVAAARSDGATWQQIADEMRLASRQGAQKKFSAGQSLRLPGMSAAEMARRLGIHHQTVAANPALHGVIVRTYPATGNRDRKRYFLPGDEGGDAITA
jgi:hypothetical protein